MLFLNIQFPLLQVNFSKTQDFFFSYVRDPRFNPACLRRGETKGARFALAFGPAENFVLTVLGVILLSNLNRRSRGPDPLHDHVVCCRAGNGPSIYDAYLEIKSRDPFQEIETMSNQPRARHLE